MADDTAAPLGSVPMPEAAPAGSVPMPGAGFQSTTLSQVAPIGSVPMPQAGPPGSVPMPQAGPPGSVPMPQSRPWWVTPKPLAQTPMGAVEQSGLAGFVQDQASSPSAVMSAQIAGQIGKDTSTALSPLVWPLRAGAGLVARAAGMSQELIGDLPAKPGLKDYFNQVVPDRTFMDLQDLFGTKVLGTQDQYVNEKTAQGMSAADATQSYNDKMLFFRGMGLLEDFTLDPFVATSFGQYDKAARMARMEGSFKGAADVLEDAAKAGNPIDLSTLDGKMRMIEGLGQYTDNSRNVITLHAPFNPDKEIASIPYTGTPIESVVNRVRDSGVGQSVAKIADALDYRSGIPELDQGYAVNQAEKRGIFQRVVGDYAAQEKMNGFSDDEKRLVQRLMENTPNLMPPEIPATRTAQTAKTVYQNVDGELKPVTQMLEQRQNVGRGLGVYNEDYLERSMQRQFGNLSQGLQINKERTDQIVNAAMDLKRGYSRLNATNYVNGVTSDNALGIIKRYAAHVPTPEGEAAARAALDVKRLGGSKLADDRALEIELQAQERRLTQATGSRFSTFNQGMMKRLAQGDLETVEKSMSQHYGVDKFYVDDPFMAYAMRRARTESVIADKKLMDTVSKYGIVPKTAGETSALEARGWEILKHPEFNNRVVTVNGKPMKYQDLYFSRDLSAKLMNWLKPNQVGMFGAWMNQANNVLKSIALATPGHFARNTIEDMFKYYANGGDLAGLRKGIMIGLQPMIDKSGMKMIDVGGRSVSLAKMRAEVEGLRNASQYSENMAYAIEHGKSLFSRIGDSAMHMNPAEIAKTLVQTFHHLGEKGTNMMRYATYANLLDRGYKPASAIFHTQHLMFDFAQASKTVRNLRTWWDPFVNHAIKTAFITPELIAKNPQAYNFFISNLPKYVSWVMGDPVKNQYIQQIIPSYARARGSVGIPLFGDTLLASLFNPPQNGKWAAMVTPEFGPGILHRFNFMSEDFWHWRTGLGAILQGAMTAVNGTDMNQKSVDLDPGHPTWYGRVLRGALDATTNTIFSTPGVWREIQSQAGLGDAKYAPSTNMKLIQAAFGQFLRFDNLSRDYVMKQALFGKAETDLRKQLMGALMKDAAGRTGAQIFSGSPTISMIQKNTYPTTAQQLWETYINRASDFKEAQAAMGGIVGQKTPEQVVSEIKGVHQAIGRMNEQHEAQMRALLSVRHSR